MQRLTSGRACLTQTLQARHSRLEMQGQGSFCTPIQNASACDFELLQQGFTAREFDVGWCDNSYRVALMTAHATWLVSLS